LPLPVAPLRIVTEERAIVAAISRAGRAPAGSRRSERGESTRGVPPRGRGSRDLAFEPGDLAGVD